MFSLSLGCVQPQQGSLGSPAFGEGQQQPVKTCLGCQTREQASLRIYSYCITCGRAQAPGGKEASRASDRGRKHLQACVWPAVKAVACKGDDKTPQLKQGSRGGGAYADPEMEGKPKGLHLNMLVCYVMGFIPCSYMHVVILIVHIPLFTILAPDDPFLFPTSLLPLCPLPPPVSVTRLTSG